MKKDRTIIVSFTPSNDAIIAPFQGRDPWVWGQTAILGRIAWRRIRRFKEDWLWNGVKLVGLELEDVDVDVDLARVNDVTSDCNDAALRE